MRRITFRERLSYAFDNMMAKGTGALIGALALSTFILILIFTVILLVAGIANSQNPLIVAWECLMCTIDTGTVTADPPKDNEWHRPVILLLVTFGGIFIFSTLIGILTAGIHAKLDELQKGRSKVIEEDHTVLLGWSPQVFTIIPQLIIANENQPSSCVVLLGDKDKVEMQDEIRGRVNCGGKTRIVCRRGKPIEMDDLDLVSINTARSIVICSPESEDPDSRVIKTMLAIMNNPNRREDPYHIVAAIHDPANIEVAMMIGRDEVKILLTGVLVAKIIAQTCLQSGLSVVYMELLNFEGDEIYYQEEPKLVGKTYYDVLMAYEDSTVIGIRPQFCDPVVNPPMDTVINAGDEVVAISTDDDTVILSGNSDITIMTEAMNGHTTLSDEPVQILILGWNWRTPQVIRELHNYFPEGSSVRIVADITDEKAQEARRSKEIQRETVSFEQGGTTDNETLQSLQLERYRHVIVMCYSDKLDPQEADAKTLVTLLHLREIKSKHGFEFSIVSEMLDDSNRRLAEVTRADDFVVSETIISLLLSQISENKSLSSVFSGLFTVEGSEIYLRPVEDYVKPGENVNFYTVVESARRRHETAIGYRLHSLIHDAGKSYGVVINPDKSIELSFSKGDRIIVISEN